MRWSKEVQSLTDLLINLSGLVTISGENADPSETVSKRFAALHLLRVVNG